MLRLALLLFLISPTTTVDHAIYISIVEINYNSTTKSADLSVKVFTDDLQDVLRNFSDDYVPQPSTGFISNNRSLLEKYFQDNLRLEANGELLQLKFAAAREESDAHFLTFVPTHSKRKWEKLKIDGNFFSELFPDQSNVVNLKVDAKKYFARLTKSNPTYEFTFD